MMIKKMTSREPPEVASDTDVQQQQQPQCKHGIMYSNAQASRRVPIKPKLN